MACSETDLGPMNMKSMRIQATTRHTSMFGNAKKNHELKLRSVRSYALKINGKRLEETKAKRTLNQVAKIFDMIRGSRCSRLRKHLHEHVRVTSDTKMTKVCRENLIF